MKPFTEHIQEARNRSDVSNTLKSEKAPDIEYGIMQGRGAIDITYHPKRTSINVDADGIDSPEGAKSTGKQIEKRLKKAQENFERELEKIQKDLGGK